MSTSVAPPPARGRDEPPAVVVLDDADRWSLQRLLDLHPYSGCVLAARLAAVGTLERGRLGGRVYGVRDPGNHQIRSACFVGGSVVVVGTDVADLQALGRAVARTSRRATELVGETGALRALWSELGVGWAPSRIERWHQPLLVIDRPTSVTPDPAVRRAVAADLDVYVPAAAAMFTAELGVSPFAAGGEAAYRARVAGVVNAGRAFLRLDGAGRVVFKAEVGAVSAATAQVQGVWVAPPFRRQGVATGAMAAVVQGALGMAPAVSLYVNDFNTPARRLYDRLGFTGVGELATVLF